MKVILFCVLRKFFVRLNFDDNPIIIEKRLFIRSTAVIRTESIVRTRVRRTPFLRLIRAKEVTLFTLNGDVLFWLSENETPDFLPKSGSVKLSPRFPEQLFGAFIDTRALAAVTFSAAALRKLGSVFGENYLDLTLKALFTTAEELTNALEIAHIVLPRLFIFIGITALSAWLFAFLGKVLSLSRFRLSRNGSEIYVRSGLFTLYENRLVLNSAVISRSTLFSIITGRAPLYFRGVMVYPCADSAVRTKILRGFFRMSAPTAAVKSSRRVIVGRCLPPLWMLAGCSAGLVIFDNPLLATIFTLGIILALYLFVLFLLFSLNAKSSFFGDYIVISSRAGTALCTAFLPRAAVTSYRISHTVFGERSELCRLRITTIERAFCTRSACSAAYAPVEKS